MKKLKYLVILFIVLLSVGCGSKDGEKVLKEALENMKDVNSGTISSEVSVAMEGQSITMSMSTDFTADHDSYSKNIANILGTELTSYMYSIVEGDKVHIYNSEDGVIWNYETLDSADYIENSVSVESIGNFAENYKSVSEVKSDKKGYTKLELVVDKDKMMKTLAANQELGSDASFELSEDLKIYVYIKDGYITNLNIDFTDVLKASDDSVTNYSLNFTISNHNQINEIVVPKEVSENAVTVDPDAEPIELPEE